MARVGWLRASLIALLPAPIALAACADDPLETCSSPAACAGEQQGDELGAASGSDAGGDGAAGACTSDAECDDGNACTSDTCVAGSCARAPVGEGEMVGMLGCLAVRCEGGAEKGGPAPAGTFCEGTRLCDGSGACVPCNGSVSCPEGYACRGDGACALALGAQCDTDAACASEHCVGGQCCQSACGECQTCDAAQGFSACAFVPAYESHPTCAAGEVCNGAGACALPDGEVCWLDDDCASDSCVPKGYIRVCAP